MKCPICSFGELKPGTTTELYERDGKYVIVEAIPAKMCESCGEAVTSAELTNLLLKAIDGAFASIVPGQRVVIARLEELPSGETVLPEKLRLVS